MLPPLIVAVVQVVLEITSPSLGHGLFYFKSNGRALVDLLSFATINGVQGVTDGENKYSAHPWKTLNHGTAEDIDTVFFRVLGTGLSRWVI